MTTHADSNSASAAKLTADQNYLISSLLCDAVAGGRALSDLPSVRDALVKEFQALNAETAGMGG
jgi:hypothetical protein